MTTKPTKASSPDASDLDAIAAELAGLGEPPASLDELAVDDDVDVATVATFADIANTDVASLPRLDELAMRRVFKRLQGRVAHVATTSPAADPHEPAANSGAGWRSVVAGLAVAAGLILVPRLSTPTSEVEPATAQRDYAEIGEAAHQALDVLGEQGAPRARSLAADYAARLATGGEHP